MSRTRQLRRAHTRILGVGLAISLAVHAAVLALVTFDAPVQATKQPYVIRLDQAAPTAKPHVLRVVRMTLPAPQQPADKAGAGQADSRASSAAGGRFVPSAAGPGAVLLTASARAVEGFNRLIVWDPRLNAEDDPVAFADLPAAVTTPLPAPADEDEPYVPGTIGNAKRQWASSGAGEAREGMGRGRFVVVDGGGHCPMPGRRGPGPSRDGF